MENTKNKMNNSLESLRHRPHVVILGAGASVAAIPNGDKLGRKISVMDGFISTLGMDNVLAGLNIKSNNLEDIFSELFAHPEYDAIRQQLEDSIRTYFTQYCLPDEPTIYDLLLLSLKEKDAVATFNWDPLLTEAYIRCRTITTKLPRILYLHGNVSVQLCMKDQIYFMNNHIMCPKCNNRLIPCKLLYPIRKKNYNENPFIKSQWEELNYYLSQAYIVTIFGYSAPSTDIEAVELLHSAWGDRESRKFEEIEIIDIKSDEELRRKWDSFIYSHHYRTYSSFYDSLIAQSPRRTTEDLFASLMEAQWLDFPNKLSPKMTWEQINSHFKSILQVERQTTSQ